MATTISPIIIWTFTERCMIAHTAFLNLWQLYETSQFWNWWCLLQICVTLSIASRFHIIPPPGQRDEVLRWHLDPLDRYAHHLHLMMRLILIFDDHHHVDNRIKHTSLNSLLTSQPTHPFQQHPSKQWRLIYDPGYSPTPVCPPGPGKLWRG